MKCAAIVLVVALTAVLSLPGMAEDPAGETAMVKSVILSGNGESGNTLPGEPLLPIQSDDSEATEGSSGEAETGPDAGQAPSAGDPGIPAWDDTTQQGGGQAPMGGDGKEVPGIVMTLEKPALVLEGIRIGIDPGHQAKGNNEKETIAPNSSQTKPKVSSGTSGTATHIAEYVTVLEISLKLRDSLEAQGAQVYMTRESHDVNISNQERAKMMNEAGVDLVLRIHCDGANNRSKRGIALYCSKSNSIAAESHRAAEAILPAVCAATGANGNGIVSNDNYTGQNWSTVPCIMVECGFLSNPEEDALLNDDAYQQKLADGLTQGIIDYIALRDGR